MLEVETNNKLQVNVESLKLEKSEDDGLNWIAVTTDLKNRFLFQDNISKTNVAMPKTTACYRWKANGLKKQEWVGESFCISNNTGSTNAINQNVILIYPNPANDFIKIDLTAASIVKIYSMTGVLMFSEKFDFTTANIDLSGLSRSNYSVEINDGKNILRQLINKK